MSANSHKEVVGFDVSVDEVLVMNEFNATYHLVGQHQHRFHGEPSGAEIEQILQGGTQQIHDQDIVVPFWTVPANMWNANTTWKIETIYLFNLFCSLWGINFHFLEPRFEPTLLSDMGLGQLKRSRISDRAVVDVGQQEIFFISLRLM